MASLTAPLLKQLERVIEQITDANRRLQDVLLASPLKSSDVQRYQADLVSLEARRAFLVEELRHNAARDAGPLQNSSAVGSFRQQVIDILDDVGLPLSPRTVSELAWATRGTRLETARFASLRRDERRAYDKDPSGRNAWIVPAISVIELRPMPRLLTMSAWPLETRLIGSRTPRTQHLRFILYLADLHGRLAASGSHQAELGVLSLLRRATAALPGFAATDVSAAINRVCGVVNDELGRILPLDLTELRPAAERLRQLSPRVQTFGGLEVVDGTAENARHMA